MAERLPSPGTPARVASDGYVSVLASVAELEELAEEWDALALTSGSPFSTVAWLSSWWEAYGTGTMAVLVLRDAHGKLLAGIPCRRVSRTTWASMSNIQSGRWEAVAVDEAAERAAWRALTRLAPGLRLHGLVETDGGTAVARAELAAAGYRTVTTSGNRSPRVQLPSTYEELLATRSKSLRKELNSKYRALRKIGPVRLRVISGGPDLPKALDEAFRLEGSGWKTRAGTAILSDPPLERLYRGFACRAAERGWLRLCLLDVGGDVVATDFDCAFGGVEYSLKTGYDERFRQCSPGLVLTAEVLRSAIEEGLSAFDFLGDPDFHKLRWTRTIRPRVGLRAYRGVSTLPEALYWRHGRPALKWLAQRTVRRPSSAHPGGAAPTPPA
jgi:CelD/BcsL family acetyltransferase involved in cellulose biosynthesis